MAFDDFQLLQQMPNFANRPDDTEATTILPVQLSQARQEMFFPAQQFSVLRFEFLFMSKGEQNGFLDFFNDAAGRHEAFWLPSWRRDLIVTAGIEVGSDELTVQDTGFHDAWDPAAEGDPGRFVFLWSRTQGLLTRRVESHTATTVTFENDLDWTDPAAIVGIIYLVRFDDDLLTIKSLAPGRTRCSCAFRQVKTPNEEA